jgi:ribosomal protein S18 acetylase RimI-like enzyme
VNVRRASEADFGTVVELWREFYREVPEPTHEEHDEAQEIREIETHVRAGRAFLAESDVGDPVGFALFWKKSPRLGFLSDLYVRPDARRSGVARSLVSEVVAVLQADGVEDLALDVRVDNAGARAVYARWRMRETKVTLVAPVSDLAGRLRGEPVSGQSFGSIHVQTDDLAAVERAVRQFVPRLPGRSRGSIVVPPRNGWIAVYDDVTDRDPRMLRRLARELGDRMGTVVLALGVEAGEVARFILYERGSIVDEYLSVQQYYGPLPPGDVIALAANPRVVARLTGANPEAVRAAAVHASAPEDLPPAGDVLAGLADAIGIEGAEHGWADAPELPEAIRIERGS